MGIELSFAMLGSTGAGKTTLLACMNKELERLNPGAFFPTDPQSFSTLNKAYNALRDEANDRTHYEFGVGVENTVENTESLSEYVFTIRGSEGSTEAKFYDFPGGWMDPDKTEDFEKVRDILRKSMAVIAAVNTPCLMESGGKFKERARIPEMIHLLKMSLEDNSQNKLFLIVPIKCEKYTRTPKDCEKLQAVLSEEFGEVFRLKDNPSYKDRLAIVMLPVHTAGNVYFSRFDKDNRNREIYTKNRDKGFSPQYVDQPLRIAMSFLLETSPSLAADMGLRKSAEYIRSGMDLDNANFSVVCGRNLILGQKNIGAAQTTSTTTTATTMQTSTISTAPMGKTQDSYTIAIMGAMGAGKTIFLLSYLYAAMQLGMGRHNITANFSDKDMEKLKEDIDKLINRGIRPISTSTYDNMSFNAGGNMSVNLFDVPGEQTQLLVPQVTERLKSADGAIFFIDGKDLVYEPEKVIADNLAFGKAIAMLRENTFRNMAGRLLGRKDVPIWFIITKCDAIPEISEDELRKHIGVLLKNAAENKRSGKWAEKLFRKGKRVKIFRVQSMGKWLSPTTPPTRENFNPVNVIEAMDSLLDEMRKSENRYLRIFMMVLAVMVVTGTVAGLGFLYSAVWLTDHGLWRTAMERTERAIKDGKYTEARREIDEFISPAYMGLYLKPMRADSLKDSEGYKKLEEAMYTELERRLGAISYDVMPEIDAQFIKSKNLLEQYLDVRQFETLAKDHYAQLQGKEWYFIAGTDYNYEPNDDAKADDIMKAIERCLNGKYSTPDSWSEMKRVKLEGMLSAWVKRLPTNVSMAELDKYTSNAVQLMNNPSMPETLRDDLNNQCLKWNGLKSDQWRQLAEDWISEASRLPVQDGIGALKVHLEKTEISEPAKERLKDALDGLYLKQAAEWVNIAFKMPPAEGVRELELRRKTAGNDSAREYIGKSITELRVREAEEWIEEASRENLPYRSVIGKLKKHLAKNLIPEARNMLENRITTLWDLQADEWIREAENSQQASQGISSLKAALAQDDIPPNIKSRLERSLENLQTREANELVEKASDLLNNGKAEEGARILQERIKRESNELMKSRLQRELESFRSRMVDSWIEHADKQEPERGIVSLTAHVKDKGLSENDRQRIDDKISGMERDLIVRWLEEARKSQPEDRIAVLAMYCDKSPTENIRDRMQREIGSTYNEIVNIALNEYPDNVQKLRDLFMRLSHGRDMPDNVRETLQRAITDAENEAREVYSRDVLRKIGAAKNFDELVRLIHDSDVDTNNEAVQTRISSTVQKLLVSDLSAIQNEANDYARAGKFSEAKKLIESKCSSLRGNILSSVTGRGRSAIISQFDTRREAMLSDMAAEHLRICRNSFNVNRLTNSGVTGTISQLNGYLSVWPESREADTVSRVINYLHAIENGVRGYFRVVSGKFPNTERSFDTPDVRVSVSGALRFDIPVKENEENPSFGYGLSFTWKPNAGAIYIKAYEVDTFGSDIEILSVRIDSSGWDGISSLTGNHSDKGNSIYTRFDGSLPSCPW